MATRFLVTAGNTRERIDRVRDWGNIFTGNTGFAIARCLSRFGDVDLVTSTKSHSEEVARVGGEFPERLGGSNSCAGRVRAFPFVTHADLRGVLQGLMQGGNYAAVVMTAAVSDYTPAGVYRVIERDRTPAGMERWLVEDVSAGKVKSEYDRIAVLGDRTEKLVDLFRAEWGFRGLLVKFKLEVGLEDEELKRVGEASRRASRAELLVANTLGMVESAGGAVRGGAYLISDTGAEWVDRGKLAERVASAVAERLGSGG